MFFNLNIVFNSKQCLVIGYWIYIVWFKQTDKFHIDETKKGSVIKKHLKISSFHCYCTKSYFV